MCKEIKVNQLLDSFALALAFLRSMSVVDPLVRWMPHKRGFLAVPNWAVIEYMLNSEASICVSVYQGPEPFENPPATLRPGRPGYARFKLSSGEEVNRMYPVLLESFRRFTHRCEKAA